MGKPYHFSVFIIPVTYIETILIKIDQNVEISRPQRNYGSCFPD